MKTTYLAFLLLLSSIAIHAQEVVPLPSDSIEKPKAMEIVLDTVLVTAPQPDPRLERKGGGSSKVTHIGRHAHGYGLALREGYEASVATTTFIRPFQRFDIEPMTTEVEENGLTKVSTRMKIVHRTGLLDRLKENISFYLLGGKYLTQTGYYINPGITTNYRTTINKRHILYAKLFGGYYWHRYKAYKSDAPTFRVEMTYTFDLLNDLYIGASLPYGYHVEEGVLVGFSEYESHFTPLVYGQFFINQWNMYMGAGHTWQTDGGYCYKSPMAAATAFYTIPIPFFRKLKWQMSVGAGGVYKKDHSSAFLTVQWNFVEEKSLPWSSYYK